MSRPKRTPVGDRASITYQRNQTQETSSRGAAFVDDGAPQVYQSNDKCSCFKTGRGPQSPDLLSTAELISAAGRVWSRVNPPADFESHSQLNQTNCRYRKSISLRNLSGKAVGCAPSSYDEDKSSFCVNSTITSRSTYMVRQSSERFTVTQKLLVSTPHVSSCTFVWPIRRTGTYFPELKKVYGWMKDRHHADPQSPLINSKEGNGCEMCSEGSKRRKMEHHSSDATLHGDGFALKRTNCSCNLVESEDFARHVTAEASSLPSDFVAASLQEFNMSACFTKVPIYVLWRDYSFDFVSPHKCTFAKLLDDSEVHSSTTHDRLQELLTEDDKKGPTNTELQERQTYALAKQEHAFAGAFAGTFVSLCLHPIDTVKTVVQSCRINQKPIWLIGRSVIAERGIMGLYRGLASNIACSAPISGIYAFTYESVKGALLPVVSKEYHSFTHCTAGGCASIATSFVFTPSEHVKQQMQVGSRYQNCWNALVGIIKNGGLSSLYAGWGAVLCRNVPHSIIKFYTYESLKGLILAPQSSGGLPNASQMLVCGGLAGSTAALFTTPFDVVKTRLQTQVPGSPCRYDGVLHAVRDISKHEGLKGLYRGLLPRILMYMSQGALFFTSYECLKQLLSSEMPGLDAGGLLCEPNVEDDRGAPHCENARRSLTTG